MTSPLKHRIAMTVAGAFVISGIVHLVSPKVFRPLMPRRLPRQTEIIYASGVAELVCAYGLMRRQRWAGYASAAVLVAVLPGNLTQAQYLTSRSGATSAPAMIAWARVPLQIPMIWAVLPDKEN
ncbi:MAG: DoxX family protein [Candidatus Nanopelagicales bacterium]